MRRLKKRNFIFVVEIASRRVRAIIEGPNERAVQRERREQVDAAFLQKTNELALKFPAGAYDVVLTRASSVDAIMLAFPEFSGWEQIKLEGIAIALIVLPILR